MATPFMSLSLPTVSVTSGPEWASQLNTALTTIDEHDHSTGKGTKVTPAGLNINADLEINGNDLTEVRSTQYENQSAELAGLTDIRCLYVSENNLYYNNESGTPVQITSGAGLNAASLGGIGGDYGTSPASVTYSNSAKKYSFLQNSGITAFIDAGAYTIRENVSSANGVTLKSPTSLGASYDLTFPTALPGTGTTKFLTVNSSGSVGAQYDVDNTTIEISSNNLRVKDSSITTAKLNNGAVTLAKQAARTVTTDGTDPGIGGVSISTGSGTFNQNTGVGFEDVTNLSCTITTTGRPVMIQVISDSASEAASTQSHFGIAATGTTSAIAVIFAFRFLRGSTTVANALFSTWNQSTSGSDSKGGAWGVDTLRTIDTPAAGTYTYKLQMSYTGTGSGRIRFAKLVVYEM